MSNRRTRVRPVTPGPVSHDAYPNCGRRAWKSVAA
jgi:hypothetical protein